mgnify:CR=1 FL=1
MLVQIVIVPSSKLFLVYNIPHSLLLIVQEKAEIRRETWNAQFFIKHAQHSEENPKSGLQKCRWNTWNTHWSGVKAI